MTAAILQMLPKKRGRPQPADGRNILRLYPNHVSSRGTYIYAIAFEGGVLKVGRSWVPRDRLGNHWARCDGQVKWVHVFRPMDKSAAVRAELKFPAALRVLGRQINGSEWYFADIPRQVVIEAMRPVINECVVEHEAWAAERAQEARLRKAATELLIASGHLPAGGRF